jgi:predicted metal-dependent enzyme (double-stranded beta helix superfamily)
MPEQPARLREFIEAVASLVDAPRDEDAVLAGVRAATAELVARDDWLPAEMAKPHPQFFQQYLLYCDPRERFSVVSFVWGPGQGTPVHDHTVWGVIGMLRGAELCEPFRMERGAVVPAGPAVRLEPGHIEAVSPAIGDIHRVSNAFADRVSISIHTYGANIGRVKRHVYDLATGEVKDFVSGYANA